MKLVHIDCETTGLDDRVHEICEVAWAVDNGPVKYGKVDFDPTEVDSEAMEINKFYDRQADLPEADLDELRKDLEGATLCGMNVRFDAGFLRELIGEEIWSYRLLDIQSYAMGVLNSVTPMSSRNIKKVLDTMLESLVLPPLRNSPDHTARGDVESQREMFNVLRNLNNMAWTSSDFWDRK